jgi:hypothetical protein
MIPLSLNVSSNITPIMAMQSQACIHGRSFAGIAGSNPAGDMDICLLWLLCVVRQRYLREVDQISKFFDSNYFYTFCQAVSSFQMRRA